MTERIFISNRRDDSAGHAGRVFDRLKADFGDDVLFMDVDTIPLGANFVRVLREEVAKCSSLLAIIGPSWLNAKDEDGARRLDNPKDFVRVEIAAALQRDIPAIPILLEGARIPKVQTLPDDLKELSERNALDVRHASFHADMDKLVRGLRAVSGATGTSGTALAKQATKPITLSENTPRQSAHAPSVDKVIAAKGKWVKEFKVDPGAKVPPDIFSHIFVRAVGTSADKYVTAGTILTGQKWDRSDSPNWKVVHGYCKSDAPVCSFSLMAYLGPTWLPEYAQLSDAVFKKLSGKLLERFVKHP